MTVFKGYLKGALRQKTVICLYLVIFLGLGILMTMSMDENGNDTYTSESIQMAVIDRDHSALSEGIRDYLGKTQTLVDVEDKKDVLNEELYYGNIQYVLVIPENFESDFLNEIKAGETAAESSTEKDAGEKSSKSTDGQEAAGTKLLQGTGRPGSTQSYYASELVNSYLSGISLYLQSGSDTQQAVEAMTKLDTPDGMTVMQEGSNSMSKVAGTLQYLPYILTALSCYVVGFVMLDHQRLEIRRRLAVSAVSPAKRTAQMLLAMAVIGVAFYVVSLVMVAVMNPTGIGSEPHKGYYMGNVATMVVVGLSIAFLVVHLARTGNGINGLANVIALGMSFICGVFIPDSMLSSPVKKVAAYLPVYWYEQNNEILGTHSALSHSMIGNLQKGYIRQLIFAGAVIVVALVIGKVRGRKE